eukprot:SAG11_NODE_10580_length_819_cov_1.652778_1_plen_100_part_00
MMLIDVAHSSWDGIGPALTQKDIHANIKLLVSTGLARASFAFVGIDEGWECCGCGVNSSQHDERGRPVINMTRFPDMASLVEVGHQPADGLVSQRLCVR